jgi:hypothetical protein
VQAVGRLQNNKIYLFTDVQILLHLAEGGEHHRPLASWAENIITTESDTKNRAILLFVYSLGCVLLIRIWHYVFALFSSCQILITKNYNNPTLCKQSTSDFWRQYYYVGPGAQEPSYAEMAPKKIDSREKIFIPFV